MYPPEYLGKPQSLRNTFCVLSRSPERCLGRHDRRFCLSERIHELLVQIEVDFDKIRRRQREPLIERYVSIVRALEDLQKSQGRRAGVLDIMTHREGDIADVSAAEIERPRLTAGGEHAHAPLTADVILPFVGVGMPVQLAQATGVDLDKGRGDVFGGGKYARVGDPHGSVLGADWLLREHAMAEGLRNRFGAHELIGAERTRDRRFENVELARVRRLSEQRWPHAEILAQNLGRDMLEPVAEQKRVVLVKVAIVEDKQEFAAVRS